MARSSGTHNRPKYEEAIKHRQALEKEYSLWVLLNQARDSIFKAREKELVKYGISTPQAAVLFISRMIDGEVTPSEISRWLLKEPHTVSAILSRMEQQGLVKKVRNAGNKRNVNVTLTEAGEQAFRNSERTESIKDIVSCLSLQERKQLSSLLTKLRDAALDYTTKVRVPFP